MELNRYFDHTLLKAEATSDQVLKLCDEALEYHFASVCVNPCPPGCRQARRKRCEGLHRHRFPARGQRARREGHGSRARGG